MRDDPTIATFQAESAHYRQIMAEIRLLESKIAGTGLTDSEQARWAELGGQAADERRRLNAMMYAANVDSEQRAAMWWLMQPESTTPEGE